MSWLCASLSGSALFGADSVPFKGNGICQFALHGYVLAPQSEALINQTVEKLMEQHQLVFGFKRNPQFRLRIRVYASYQDFTNAMPQKSSVPLEGVYIYSRKEILTYKQGLPGTIGTTLLHEASHAIMDEYFDHLQLWLAEGAAEYFSYALARTPQNTMTLQKRWAQLNTWMRDGQLVPLEKLLNASESEWKALDPDMAYAASWSLFQMLMSTEANKKILKTVLWEWQERRQRRVDCAGQFARLYSGGMQALERDWFRWIDKTGSAEVFKAVFRGNGICRFATRGYELAPQLEANINREVEALLARHREVLGITTRSNFFVRVRIFGAFTDFAQFTSNPLISGWDVKAKDLTLVQGYYSPFLKEIVACAERSPEQMAHTIAYLANNALLTEHWQKIPRWVGSGCADYFTASVKAGRDGERLAAAWARTGLGSTAMTPISTLLNDASTVWKQEGGADQRKIEVACWALFHFLAASKPNQQVLQGMMKSLQGLPGAGLNCGQQLERLYPGGVNRLEVDFGNWLRTILQH